MGDIIDFNNHKVTNKEDTSEYLLSLDMFTDPNTSEIWARISDAGDIDIDAEWLSSFATQLRQLAWITDGMAAKEANNESAPIACITVFEDTRVNTMHNDDKVETLEQVDWISDQLGLGCDQIRSSIQE
mgnify:CR=1 FL=1